MYVSNNSHESLCFAVPETCLQGEEDHPFPKTLSLQHQNYSPDSTGQRLMFIIIPASSGVTINC